MNISSKRFHVKDIGGGLVSIHDMNAPYHPHTIDRAEMPSVDAMAAMSERQFDARMHRLAYGVEQ